MELAVDHSHRTSRSGALQNVISELGQRVKPVALARERTLPVTHPFDRLLPDGLVRGQVVSCRGSGARSVAFGMVNATLAAGAWMAIVDVPTFGTDAAAEFGVPLERVVRVETAVAGSMSGSCWVDAMGAAVDGFDLVLTRVPAELHDRRPAAVRKLSTRVRQKGAVVVTLGSPGALGVDVELTTERTIWSGLGDGSGHLMRRVVDVQASGRRIPERRFCTIEMCGTGSRVKMDRTEMDQVEMVAERDPQAEVLAEMAGMAGMAGQVEVNDLNDQRLVG